MPGLSVCTLASWNYLSYVRLLAKSLAEHNPGTPLYVGIVDRPRGVVDLSREPFIPVFADELGIERLEAMAFRYSVLELNTALKPYLIEHLQQRFGADPIVYFDPDIIVLRDLTPVIEQLTRHELLVTPHVTGPIDDDWTPQEVDLLVSGVYNLGFIAVRASAATREFIAWWKTRLYTHCLRDPRTGVFTDQKWIDFAPAFVANTGIIRDPGWNVAYWNLRHRQLAREGGEWTANGSPIVFFHYSGFDPSHPEKISRYQPQTLAADRPDVQTLLELCARRLAEEGLASTSALPYGFGAFDNAVPVPPVLRRILREVDPRGERFPDPFATGDGSFFRWLAARAEGAGLSGAVTNLAMQLREVDDDLRWRFADVRGRAGEDLAAWIVAKNPGRWDLPADLLAPLSGSVDASKRLRARGEGAARRGYLALQGAWGAAVHRFPSLSRFVSAPLKRALRGLGWGGGSAPGK